MNAAISNDRLVSDAKESWDHGALPDARQFIAAHPTVQRQKSIVLELAYEEYFRRTAIGEDLDVDDFCDRFSICSASLRRRIEVHEFLHENADDWLDDQAWPEVGDAFGDFSLVRELGRGVESRVFLAKQRSLSNRLVVLKLSQLGFREARMMSSLEHPNIVPILSVEEDATTGLVAICMPYLSPWTLTDLIDVAFSESAPPKRFLEALLALKSDDSVPPPTVEQEPMDELLAKCSYHDGVLHVMSQVAAALHHTHDRGILHLDLKPSNILITSTGIPMVLDFNLSAEAEMKTAFGGTLPYMSAEQLQQCVAVGSRDATVSHASDVYSLGVVTYQLLTGSLPYRVPSRDAATSKTVDVLLREQAKGVPRLKAKRQLVDRDASMLVDSCLSREIERRPHSMAHVRERLKSSLSAKRRFSRWCLAHRLILTMLFVVGLFGFAGGAYSIATQDPADVRWHNRGREHMSRGEIREAIACYSRAIEMAPTNDLHWYARGMARQAKGDRTAAIDDYGEAIARRPRPEYYGRLAYVCTQQNDFGRAIHFFDKAMDGGLDTLGLHLCLGRCYQAQGDHLAAINAYGNALGEDPTSWQAHFGVARSHNNLATTAGGAVPEIAVYHIEQASRLNPESWLISMTATQILYEYGRTNFAPADMDRAIDHFERCLELGVPKDIAETFRALPELNQIPRFQKLMNNYDPVRPSPPKESLWPDPILHVVD